MKIDINGISVEFPFEPYNIQKGYMEKLIEAITTKKNALLESPTGTGKTLSSICASLAWLKDLKKNGTPKLKDPEEEKDNLQSLLKSEVGTPQIIFSSRTHSQLNQVINELKRSGYSPSGAALGSRKHLGINEKALERKAGLDQFGRVLRHMRNFQEKKVQDEDGGVDEGSGDDEGAGEDNVKTGGEYFDNF